MGWGFDCLCVGLREGYLTDLFLFSLGRGYFSLSSPDVHWDHCGIKVNENFTFKTENSTRLKPAGEGLIFKRPLT